MGRLPLSHNFPFSRPSPPLLPGENYLLRCQTKPNSGWSYFTREEVWKGQTRPRFAKGNRRLFSRLPLLQEPPGPHSQSPPRHAGCYCSHSKPVLDIYFPQCPFYLPNEMPNSLEVPFPHWSGRWAAGSHLACLQKLNSGRSPPRVLQGRPSSFRDTCLEVAQPPSLWWQWVTF